MVPSPTLFTQLTQLRYKAGQQGINAIVEPCTYNIFAWISFSAISLAHLKLLHRHGLKFEPLIEPMIRHVRSMRTFRNANYICNPSRPCSTEWDSVIPNSINSSVNIRINNLFKLLFTRSCGIKSVVNFFSLMRMSILFYSIYQNAARRVRKRLNVLRKLLPPT